MNHLSETQKAYLAGFLDGDGCINAQLVRRSNYRLQFQIRFSVTFFQSTKRHWFLLSCKKIVGCGVVQKRNDGLSEYAIVGVTNVTRLCELLLPYLRVKLTQAKLILQIASKISKDQSKDEFIALCSLVDRLNDLNDLNHSKKRTINAAMVSTVLNSEFPVETSIFNGDIVPGKT